MKTEPGPDSKPDLSVRTSVAKRSLSFNTSCIQEGEKKERKKKEKKKRKKKKRKKKVFRG